MDADRPAQPVDPAPSVEPAEPTVVQRRSSAPGSDGSDGTSAADGPESDPTGSTPAPDVPTGDTDVMRKPQIDSGATEVIRAPRRPTAPAGPPPQQPRGGNAGFGGPQPRPSAPPPPIAAAPPTIIGRVASPPAAPGYGGTNGHQPGGPTGHGHQPYPTQMYDQPGPAQGWPPGQPPGPAYGQAGDGGKRRGRLIALIVAGVVLLAGAGVGGWLLLRPRYVDPAIASAEIVRATQQTDELAATDVRCPEDAVQKRGSTFTCTATVVGKQITYTVQQNDDKGTALSVRYERPTLDVADVQEEIVSTTRKDVGVAPTDVTCPDNVHYDRNATFTCTAKLEDQPLNYTITQTDGVGGVSVAHGRVLKNAEISAKLSQLLTQAVGTTIVAQCGATGQTVIVNEPGTPIDCRAAPTADPSRIVTIPILVDRSGALSPAD